VPKTAPEAAGRGGGFLCVGLPFQMGILGGEYFPGYVVDIGDDEVLPMYEGICNKPLSIGNSNIFGIFTPKILGNSLPI